MSLKNWYVTLSITKKMLFVCALLIALLTLSVIALETFSRYTISKRINEDAPVKTNKSISIKAPAEKVFALLQDIDNWSSWQKDIPSSKINSPAQAGATFDWKTGGLTIHSTLHTVVPFSQIGWTGKAFGAFAIHNWMLTVKGGYTTVTVVESMEGWLVSLLKGQFQQRLDAGTRAWLAYLKQRAETM